MIRKILIAFSAFLLVVVLISCEKTGHMASNRRNTNDDSTNGFSLLETDSVYTTDPLKDADGTLSKTEEMPSFNELRETIMNNYLLLEGDAQLLANERHDDSFRKFVYSIDLSECLKMNLVEQYEYYRQKGFLNSKLKNFTIYLYTNKYRSFEYDHKLGIVAREIDYFSELSDYDSLKFFVNRFHPFGVGYAVITAEAYSDEHPYTMEDYANILRILDDRGDVLFIYCPCYDYDYVNTGELIGARMT